MITKALMILVLFNAPYGTVERHEYVFTGEKALTQCEAYDVTSKIPRGWKLLEAPVCKPFTPQEPVRKLRGKVPCVMRLDDPIPEWSCR